MLIYQRLRRFSAATAVDPDAKLLGQLLDIVGAGDDGLAHLGVFDGLADANVHEGRI